MSALIRETTTCVKDSAPPAYGDRMSTLSGLLRRRSVVTALKAAVACGVAFWLGSLLPDPLEQYKYYAALGAFTVVGLVVLDSVKESLQVLGAVAVGVGVAVLVQTLSWTNPLTVAVTVAAGVLLGASRMFGVQRTWAPLAGLFVLATGGPDPAPMALGYVVQVPLGALVGVVVNALVLAPLGDDDLESASRALLRTLSQQMTTYADILQAQVRDGRDDPDAAARRGEVVHDAVVELETTQSRLRSAMTQAGRARRANPRVRLHPARLAAELDRAEATSRCAATLLAVGVVLEQSSPATADEGLALRQLSATALEQAAPVIADPEAARTKPERLAESLESVQRMREQARSLSPEDGLDHILFGALALATQDCLETFARHVARAELPEIDPRD